MLPEKPEHSPCITSNLNPPVSSRTFPARRDHGWVCAISTVYAIAIGVRVALDLDPDEVMLRHHQHVRAGIADAELVEKADFSVFFFEEQAQAVTDVGVVEHGECPFGESPG